MGYSTVGNDHTTPDERATAQQGAAAAVVLASPDARPALLGQALDRHTDGLCAPVGPALHEPTAREVARSYLHETVRMGARADRRHDHTIVVIRDRMQRALDDGDLPPDADPDLLARHLMTLSNGIAVQAGDGVHADQLRAIADLALQSWPAA